MNTEIEPLPAGLHAGIPMARYVADDLAPTPSLNAGTAHTILTRSEFHAWWEHPRLGGNRDESNTASDIGSVIHDVLLGGPGIVEVIRPEDYPGVKGGIPKGWTNDAIRAARDEAIADGKIPLLADDWALCGAAVDAARIFLTKTELFHIFDEGTAELTALWQDDDDVWCRARPDWWNPKMKTVLDIKTTKTPARPDVWIRRQLNPMGYDLSAVHYLRGIERLTDIRAQYVFLVIEQDPPHGCSLVTLSPSYLAVAEAQWEKAFGRWQHALAVDKWPSYPTGIAHADPTARQMVEAEAEA